MKTVLVVDDEKNYLLTLRTILEDEGYEVLTTQDPVKALQMFEEEAPDLVLTDMKMPGITGMQLLTTLKKKRGELPVIVLTAFGTVETAVEAMRAGAFHYILKPFQNDEIRMVVRRALEMADLAEGKKLLSQELSDRFGGEKFVAESPQMKAVSELVSQVAQVKTTILIYGESGTGKEVIARLIHDRSTRSDKPFIAVNCGALTETLLESELFGHEKGAFTGATTQKKGRFELADGGTLFLDEVGTMSHALQIRLLRVLQEQSFERVGGSKAIKVDVRIIAASNRDLKQMSKTGEFREDLYYRLNVFMVQVPPLRERVDDIIPLALHFIKMFSKEMGKQVKLISQEATQCLIRYPWPGNVRELKNAVERAVVISLGTEIELGNLPMDLRELQSDMDSRISEFNAALPAGISLPVYIDDIEKKLIHNALSSSGGIHAKAARILGISPTSLQYKLSKYNLS